MRFLDFLFFLLKTVFRKSKVFFLSLILFFTGSLSYANGCLTEKELGIKIDQAMKDEEIFNMACHAPSPLCIKKCGEVDFIKQQTHYCPSDPMNMILITLDKPICDGWQGLSIPAKADKQIASEQNEECEEGQERRSGGDCEGEITEETAQALCQQEIQKAIDCCSPNAACGGLTQNLQNTDSLTKSAPLLGNLGATFLAFQNDPTLSQIAPLVACSSDALNQSSAYYDTNKHFEACEVAINSCKTACSGVSSSTNVSELTIGIESNPDNSSQCQTPNRHPKQILVQQKEATRNNALQNVACVLTLSQGLFKPSDNSNKNIALKKPSLSDLPPSVIEEVKRFQDKTNTQNPEGLTLSSTEDFSLRPPPKSPSQTQRATGYGGSSGSLGSGSSVQPKASEDKPSPLAKEAETLSQGFNKEANFPTSLNFKATKAEKSTG